MIKFYFVNDDELDEVDGPPPVGPLHLLPLGDWVDHVPETWCPCKPTYDADFDTYTHMAADGRLAYEKKGWLLD